MSEGYESIRNGYSDDASWLCIECGEWVTPAESGPPYDEDSGGNPTCVCQACRNDQ